MKKKILIIGGTGFIGSKLIDLPKRGFSSKLGSFEMQAR